MEIWAILTEPKKHRSAIFYFSEQETNTIRNKTIKIIRTRKRKPFPKKISSIMILFFLNGYKCITHVCERRESWGGEKLQERWCILFWAYFSFRIHILHRIYLSFERVSSTSFQMDTCDDTHHSLSHTLTHTHTAYTYSRATKWDVKSVF